MEKEKISDVSQLLNYLPEVKIDKGTFKYIMIEVSKKSEKPQEGKPVKSVIFIRGLRTCMYHANILDDFIDREMSALKLNFCDNINGKEVVDSLKKLLRIEVPGGGRIEHDAELKKIVVYGYSQGYGQANHEKTLEMISKYYVGYKSLSWNNEGY